MGAVLLEILAAAHLPSKWRTLADGVKSSVLTTPCRPSSFVTPNLNRLFLVPDGFVKQVRTCSVQWYILGLCAN